MRRVFLMFSPAFFLFFSSPHAKPRIELDTKTFDCGTVIEGKTDKINAVFTITNTGDEILRLTGVRSGCGCTVVKFDSLIAPGKKTKIESGVDIKGYRSGPISKGITVISNAENEPTIHLTITATVRTVVDISTSYLSVSNASVPVYLSSEKTDLKVSGIEFRSSDGAGSAPAWQANMPMPVRYTMTPTDSTRSDGFKVYRLEVQPVTTDRARYGEFVVKTNHPDKKELSIRGQIGG